MDKRIEQFIVCHYYELKTIAKRITKGNELTDDLLSECLLQLYEKKEIKLKQYDYNNIKYYITAVLRLNWNSNSSPFFYKYKNKQRKTDEFIDMDLPDEQQTIFESEQVLQFVEIAFTELDWMEKELFELYVVYGSARKVSKETSIPKSNVDKAIRNIKSKLKSKVENELHKL